MPRASTLLRRNIRRRDSVTKATTLAVLQYRGGRALGNKLLQVQNNISGAEDNLRQLPVLRDAERILQTLKRDYLILVTAFSEGRRISFASLNALTSAAIQFRLQTIVAVRNYRNGYNNLRID
jgi:hypothetical protein